MDLYTQLTKKEFLDELKCITTEGSPNLAAGPWRILSLLISKEDKNPFYGIITSTGFELIKNFKTIPIVVGIQGEVLEKSEQTLISTKVEYLVFPIILYVITFVLLITISIVTYIQVKNTTLILIETSFGLFMASILIAVYRIQTKQIKNLLIEKTSANKR